MFNFDAHFIVIGHLPIVILSTEYLSTVGIFKSKNIKFFLWGGHLICPQLWAGENVHPTRLDLLQKSLTPQYGSVKGERGKGKGFKYILYPLPGW